VCRAIPNSNEKGDAAKMLTGAIWTRNKYAFQYGRLLVRMKTNVITGNFPAAWLGRQQKDGHKAPYGEIDVVEMFGSKQESNHNIHTQYTLEVKKIKFHILIYVVKIICYLQRITLYHIQKVEKII
jgi:beta-glucanase (GH16 family)